MTRLTLGLVFSLVAVSAHAQSAYVAGTVGADVSRLGRTESNISQTFSADTEVFSWSLRLGTAVGQKLTGSISNVTFGHVNIDPMTGAAKWQTGFKSPNWAGTLVTAGGLVFTGELTGEFIAVDSDTGRREDNLNN